MVNNGEDFFSKYFVLKNDIIFNDETFAFEKDSGLVKVSDGTNVAYLGTGILGEFAGESEEFDNTASDVIKADIKSHNFDELKPLTWNGITYAQPFSDYCFGINFVGDSAKGMLMDLLGYYVDTYEAEIKLYVGVVAKVTIEVVEE